MKKKILSLLLCAVMAVTMLAACGGNGAGNTEQGGDESGKIVLDIYAQYADDDTKVPYDYAVEKLKEKYPNVELNLIIQAQDDGTTLKTMAATGQLPDIFQANTDIINTLRETNQVMVLNDVADKTGFSAKLFESCKGLAYAEDGNMYAFPYAGDEYVLWYYNKALFDQYGLSVPTTYDELLNCIGGHLNPYTYLIKIPDLNISKDYIYSSNKISIDASSDIKDTVTYKLNIDNSKEIEAVHSSKVVNDLLDYTTIKNMHQGTKMHEIMESIDLVNPNFDGIEPWMINHIKYFLSLDILKGIENAKVYKEYEFSFTTDKKYHGIIDLLIVSENCIRIVDYKLKNINDLEYIKQINGYIDYVKSISYSNVEGYIYSLIDQTIKKI
mgnify:CR=1 FL=1